MLRSIKQAPPFFLVQEEADVAVLRKMGASVRLISDGAGVLPSDNVVLIARDDGRKRLMEMNLGRTGRFLELGLQGSVAAYVQGHPKPLALLEEAAHDVFWHEERPLGEWEVPEPLVGRPSGFDFLDPYLRWTCPELVVIAGPYGCGKSSLARLLALKWTDTLGREADASASFVAWEDKLGTVKREVTRYALGGDVNELSSSQARRLADLEKRIRWTERHPDDARLIQWYCDLVEHRATRDGVRFFVFDPFNEHDSTRAPNQTETDYVREMMTRFRKLVHGLGIILIVVTHVSAKSYDETGAIKPFRVANASGSVQFGNKADRGICILRTSKLSQASSIGADDHMVLHFDKAKDEEVMGRRGTVACVFDPKTMTLVEDRGATATTREAWS